MFVKRFVANDMQEAIRKINREFGPDAVIIESKSIRRKGITGLFKKKIVEVVAAYEPNRAEKQPVKKQTSQKATPVPEHSQDKVEPSEDVAELPQAAEALVKAEKVSDTSQIDLLDRQVKELRAAMQDFTNKIHTADRETTFAFSDDVLDLYNQLRDRDVPEELCREIATQTETIQKRRGLDAKTVGQQLICDKLGEAMPLKLKKFERNVLIFVGPTGTGKTTTLAKFAGTLKFKEHLEVGMINTDTYRVGAMEHIRLYAEIMDIPLAMAYSADELGQALDNMADKDVILIDTAGINARNEASRQELSQLVDAAHADETFLVMSVVTGAKACRDVIQQYSFLNDYKLIITKLDEVDAWGNVLNMTDYSKKRLTYVTVGQNVPDDIREADIQWLARSILDGEVICCD